MDKKKICIVISTLILILSGCYRPEKPVQLKVKKEKNRLIFKSTEIKKILLKEIEKMNINELAAQMIISYPSDKVIEQGVGGIILLPKFIKNSKKTKSLIKKYNKISKTPLLVMIDQEGGQVNRLKYIHKYRNMPCHKKISKWPDEKIVDYNFQLGDYVRSININTILAPCLDISPKGSLMYKMERSFIT